MNVLLIMYGVAVTIGFPYSSTKHWSAITSVTIVCYSNLCTFKTAAESGAHPKNLSHAKISLGKRLYYTLSCQYRYDAIIHTYHLVPHPK